MPTPHQLISLLALVLMTSQAGCVALSIPSQRRHDPTDHGGLFGDWKNVGAAAQLFSPQSHSVSDFSIDGGPLECDSLEPSFEEQKAPEKDEIPWPRYHPVPTRPVFGGQTAS